LWRTVSSWPFVGQCPSDDCSVHGRAGRSSAVARLRGNLHDLYRSTPAEQPGFTDITEASGLGKIARDHYAAHPKWWLSGLHLVDLDGDGDLDIIGYTQSGEPRRFAVYRNDLPKRHWLRVRTIGAAGNRGAAGAKIRLYAAGTQQLLWYEQVAIYDSQAAASYYALADTQRHYGLGDRTEVDVCVEFYPSGKVVRQNAVRADRALLVRE